MNDTEIHAYLQSLGWKEHYEGQPHSRYYRFRVPTQNEPEYFYLDKSKPSKIRSDAMLYLHPRFLEWRSAFEGCSGVQIGGRKGLLKLKKADMGAFPTGTGGTGNRIPECFPLRFDSKNALARAMAVIAEKVDLNFSAQSNEDDANPGEGPGMSDVGNASGKRRSISESDLLDILNRQRENGAAGERIVFEWEKKRLKDCGCVSPDDFVTHTSKNNVAAGFDIHSHWSDDHERFIEVKTTASGADFFFMSQNEKQVLTKKAGKAYVYIVDLESSGNDSGTVRDPVKFAEAALEFEPVAYRVHLTK